VRRKILTGWKMKSRGPRKPFSIDRDVYALSCNSTFVNIERSSLLSMSYCKKINYTYACGHPLVWYTYCEEPSKHTNNQEFNKHCFNNSPRSRQHRGTTNGGGIQTHCGQALCAPIAYGYFCCSCPPIPNIANQTQLVMAFVPATAIFLNAQNLPTHHFQTAHGPVEHVYCQNCRANAPAI
jgi:hypothetical protein